MCEEAKKNWDRERDKIQPRPQGPANLGDVAEPKHAEADKVAPIVVID